MVKHIKKLAVGAASAAMLLGGSSASAATGQTSFDITFNGGIVILYYANNFTLDVQSSFFAATDNIEDDQTGTVYDVTVDNPTLNLNVATASTENYAATITLQNAYAIRGFNTGGGNHQVVINKDSADTQTSNFIVDCANNAGAAAATIECVPQGMGIAQAGDVIFDADFTGTDGSTVNVSYTITVTNL